MEQIEQSLIIYDEGVKEMKEISQCLNQIPILMDQNLTMISNLKLTFAIDEYEQQQQTNVNQNGKTLDQNKKNNQLFKMKKDGFFQEMGLLKNISFSDLDFQKFRSFESIQLDKNCELTLFSHNQKKGIQNIQPNGLLSNQIFNSKFQSNLLSGPHSSRNLESKNQSFYLTSSDPKLEDNNNRWLHKYPSYIIQKTENNEKSEYPTLFKNYSQIGRNTNDASFEDQQIKQEFQTLINASKIKKEQQQQANTSFSSINKRKQDQQKQNEDLQNQNKQRRPSSPKFKFVVKQKKQSKNSGQHIKLTFEKGQKVFDISSQRLNKETSKSVEQLKINDHFLKLQNEQERELYYKPFENTKYSEISKIYTRQNHESPTAILYKKKVNKSKQNISQNTMNSMNNASNHSYDNHSGQEYEDSFDYEAQDQYIHKVDLQQLLKEKLVSPTTQSQEQSHFERNVFSFKPLIDFQQQNESNYQENMLNQKQNNQFQFTFQPQQQKQRISPIRNNDEDFRLKNEYQNEFQNQYNTKHQNQQRQHSEHNNQQSQQQNEIQGAKKQPIQIKLNIQQFMNNSNSEKQQFQEISPHSSKIVNHSNKNSQNFRTLKK
ncbi:unnamed protein product [Paramecium octaurelia]|uniref:Uncharacterized protein n=1 Tax=Paramecium octaurelia TaxID=43137 RepID=A0A8S1XMJ8_PAROT|nr:unnamed protein product [Paramecium octaurelia]